MFKRNKLAMLVAEFLGTGILTLVLLSIQRSQLGLAFFVAIGVGLAVVALTYTFGKISGAQMNPALTIALWTARRIKTLPAILFVVVQLLGAWAAYALYHYFVKTPVQEVQQAFNTRIMVAEAIGTMVFALAWASAAYHRYEVNRFAVVAGVGFTLAVIIASAASLGLANPALAVGARAWSVFGGWNGWLNYALGPLLGAVIGVNLYGLLFAPSETRFNLFKRQNAAVVASSSYDSTVSSVDEDDLEDEDDDDDDFADEDEEIVVPANSGSNHFSGVDKAINKNAKTAGAASHSGVTVTKSKRSTANKIAAKKSGNKKKR